MDVVPLLGAIVGCHCSNFGGVDVVPLLGAMAGCHCSVLWLRGRALLGAIVVCYGEGRGDDQLWGSGRGAIAGWHGRVPTLGEWTWCHCRVPLQCAMVGEGGGAIAGCHCSVPL